MKAQPQQPEDLLPRLRDAMRLAARGEPRFVGFLDERQAAFAADVICREGANRAMLWGGHEGAERVLFGAFPDWQTPDPARFPLSAFTAAYRTCDSLTHRDFLGALLACGVQRAALGDLLLEPGRCVGFCREELAPFLLSQVEKVGRVGVRLSLGAQAPYPDAHTFLPVEALASSPRVDCVLAALCGLSRSKAAALIRAGGVQVDHRLVQDPDFSLQEGALLSVRGAGRFVVDDLHTTSKKGRLRLAGRKYQ